MKIRLFKKPTFHVLFDFKTLIAIVFVFTLSSLKEVPEQNGLRWSAFNGSIPGNVVYGGDENGKKLAICRCVYNQAYHSGKVVANKCNIGWGGKEIASSNFELLLNDGANLSWANATTSMPPNAVVAGKENANTIYVGRLNYNGGVHPGKVFWNGRQFICNIGYGGKEITSTTGFTVLVAGASAQPNVNAPAITSTQANTNNQAANTGNCQAFVGHWMWHDNQFYSMKEDGTFTLFKGPIKANWKCEGGKVRINWSNGYSELRTLQADGTLAGVGSDGKNVTVRKASKSEVDALKLQHQVGDAMNDLFKKKKN